MFSTSLATKCLSLCSLFSYSRVIIHQFSILFAPFCTFKILVGPNGADRKLFTIHAAVVERLPAPLSALMNSSMREAIDGAALLEEIDNKPS